MKFLHKNQKGQIVIESVLLAVLTMAIVMTTFNYLRDNKFLAKLIDGPWQKVAGMLECGVWDTQAKACTKHPNQLARSLTLNPK